jgi:hypothetical protein
VRGDERLRGRPAERRRAGEELVRHHAERVQVGAVVRRGVGQRLLGGHVAGRADHRIGGGRVVGRRAGRRAPQRRPAERRARHGAGDPEVGDHRAALAEEHVLRLHVAVHDAARVSVRERVGHLAQHAHRLAERQGAAAREALAQRAALHVGRDVVEAPRRHPRVEQRQDVRVAEPGGDSDLVEEASRGRGAGADVGAQHLEGDVAPVANVARLVHDAHAAASQLATEGVAAGERRGEGRVGRGRGAVRAARGEERGEARGGGAVEAGVAAGAVGVQAVGEHGRGVGVQRVVAAARGAEEGVSAPGRRGERRVEQRFERRPALGRHRRGRARARMSPTHAASVRRSSMRAFAQSRCTVRTVTPRAAAISSSVIPP